MDTKTYSEKLEPLVAFLDGLTRQATVDELRSVLE